MGQLTVNLPWLIIWIVLLLLQDRFLRRRNMFFSLVLLWLTLLVSVFWDRAISALMPGVDSMWLFGTKIWILFFLLAVRHYLAYRKEKKGGPVQTAAPPDDAQQVPAPTKGEDRDEGTSQTAEDGEPQEKP